MALSKSYGMIQVAETYMDMLPVGSKIKFREEKQRYTVMASNRFFSICTKPMNAKKTVIYSIVDWYNGIRGTENLVFGMGAETKQQCEEMLERLTKAQSDISSRNFTDLNVESYELPPNHP